MQKEHVDDHEHHEGMHRHMLSMMLACLAVGIAGYFYGGLDYLWVALMGSCLVMHFMHTRRKAAKLGESS